MYDFSVQTKLHKSHSNFSVMPCLLLKCRLRFSCWLNTSVQLSCVHLYGTRILFGFALPFSLAACGALVSITVTIVRLRFCFVVGWCFCCCVDIVDDALELGSRIASNSSTEILLSSTWWSSQLSALLDANEWLLKVSVSIISALTSISLICVQCNGRCNSNSRSPIRIMTRSHILHLSCRKCCSKCWFRNACNSKYSPHTIQSNVLALARIGHTGY